VISRISQPQARIASFTSARFSSAGRTQVSVNPLLRRCTRTRQPPASIRMSSGSGRFRLEVTLVAADMARVAIAVVVIDAGPRKVETIGKPVLYSTTGARTQPISLAEDSNTSTDFAH